MCRAAMETQTQRTDLRTRRLGGMREEDLVLFLGLAVIEELLLNAVSFKISFVSIMVKQKFILLNKSG